MIGLVLSLLLFVLAFALGGAGLLGGWMGSRAPHPGPAVWIAVAAAALVTANTGVWLVRALGTPPIHDVSTDLDDPPEFRAVLPLRAADGAANPAEYLRTVESPRGEIDVPSAQRRAYPDLVPLRLPMPRRDAFELAEKVAREMGWRIAAAEPASGRIEATDSTFYFGFKDDVVIRVKGVGSASVLDVRSTSRVGLGDVGTNAARVRKYLDRVVALAGTEAKS